MSDCHCAISGPGLCVYVNEQRNGNKFPRTLDKMSTFSKFREPPAALSEEWRSWSTANSVRPADLSNAAIRHALAVTRFCSARSLGCTWAEHHALLDMSRAPYAHLYDHDTVPSEARPGATSCARLHRPNASQLLALVRDSQPAVLTGLLDGWPATRKWTDEYLAAALGERRVALSVTEGDS